MSRLTTLVSVLAAMAVFDYLVVMNPPQVWRGVALAGQDVAGMPFSQLKNHLRSRAPEPRALILVITDNGGRSAKVQIPLPHRAVVRDTASTARAVIQVGHEPEPWRRSWTRLRALFGARFDIAPTVRVRDPYRLERTLRASIAQERRMTIRVDRRPVRVRLPAPEVDVSAAANAAVASLARGSLTVRLLSTSPLPDLAALSNVRAVVTSAETTIVARNSGSRANMVRAAALLDGQVIWPGQEFSFNHGVGPRTRSRGFVKGTILEAPGRPGQGVGGGVCQVSTTLFQAALTAGLPIVERHAHSALAPYAPGLDATVNLGSGAAWKDLKFRNQFDVPLVLSATVDLRRNVCQVALLGPRSGLKVKVGVVRRGDELHIRRVVTWPNGQTTTELIPPIVKSQEV
jgi:hypothetical protein